MVYLDSNQIISFLGDGKIRLYHTVLRQNTVVSLNVIEILDYIGPDGCQESELENDFKDRKQDYMLADATKLSLWDCMLFNPDNFIGDINQLKWQHFNFSDLVSQLSRRFIIIENKEVEYPLTKKSSFDRLRGSFHEQLGSEALFRRESLDQWWAHQKFNKNFSSVRETPYKYIQECFLDSYFKENLKGRRVLDVGCGTGYYSIKMSKYAYSVIGFDYEESYIELAKKKSSENKENISFFTVDITKDIETKEVLEGSFDYIFLIDVFLFFFSREFQNKLADKKEDILKTLAGLLNDKGKIVIMDPSLFWLTPRFGSQRFPFGVVTEYRFRRFKVIPTLTEITDLFYCCGLVILKILEPNISQAYKNIDEREYSFMTQFPQWWVFELAKNP